jgi:uncharacterized lipoprotein
MTNFRAALLCMMSMLAGLSGCRSWFHSNTCNKPQAYQSASSVPPLKVPAGLDAVDTSTALKLPALNEPAPPPRTLKDPCLDSPPPFKVAKPAPAPQA